MLNEKVVATQEGVIVVEDKETFGEQRHVELEVYLGQQRNLVWTKTLCKHINPWSYNIVFLEVKKTHCIFSWFSTEQISNWRCWIFILFLFFYNHGKWKKIENERFKMKLKYNQMYFPTSMLLLFIQPTFLSFVIMVISITCLLCFYLLHENQNQLQVCPLSTSCPLPKLIQIWLGPFF